ncbi:MAG: DUF3822 family protein [Bacteroidales bacterium]
MPLLELFDETLDINSTEHYELSVQVSSDELSFSLLDTLRNKFLLLRSYEPEGSVKYDINRLRELITTDDFLTRRFRKVNIVTPSFKSTLVPAPLFEESKKDEYFRFNLQVSDGESILTNRLPEPEAFILFSLQDQLVGFLRDIFKTANLLHHLKPLFYQIYLNRRGAGNDYVHIHLEKEFLTLIVFDQNSLQFCNTFTYKTLSDIQYYVLYVLKSLGISQDEAVFFSGRTVLEDGRFSDLQNNLRNLEPAEPRGNFTFSYVFNEINLHRYINIFSSVNCE